MMIPRGCASGRCDPLNVPPPSPQRIGYHTLLLLLRYNIIHVRIIHIYCNNNTLPSPLQCRVRSPCGGGRTIFVFTLVAKSGNAARSRVAVPCGGGGQHKNVFITIIIIHIIRIHKSGALVRVRATFFFFLLLCARAPCDELAYVPGVCVCVCVRSRVVFLLRSRRRRRRAEDQQRRRHSSAVAVWCVWPNVIFLGIKNYNIHTRVTRSSL